MNFINKLLLKLTLLPGHLYQRLGINTSQLKSILTIKLIMDDRRPNTFQQFQQKKSGKPVTFATLGTMLISALMGLFFLVTFSIGKDYVNHLTFYFFIYIVLLSSTLISDFTSVLIDVRDNYIILPKPVNDKTVVIARLLHIFIHICKIVLPMVLPGVIMMFIKHSIAAGITMFIL